MKVVFLEEVDGSGLVGEIKEVKNGYARNYLLPRRLAVPATKATIERAARLTKLDAVRQEKADSAAKSVAERIDGITVQLEANVGEQGRLFGSITAADIAGQLSDRAGEKIEHRQVLLGQAIKAIGAQDVRVRLTRNVFANVTVEVISEDGEEPEFPVNDEPVTDAAREASATDTVGAVSPEMSSGKVVGAEVAPGAGDEGKTAMPAEAESQSKDDKNE